VARVASDAWPVRHRIGDGLPAMLVDDSFVQRLCDGLDVVLAAVPGTLDNFDALLDSSLAPEDVLAYLGRWVGVDVDPGVPLERRRQLVASALSLHHRRGTAGALADLVEIEAGARPAIIEGGGVGWSSVPGSPMPGTGDATIVVRLPMTEPSPASRARIDRIVAANKPAHLGHRLEFALPAPAVPPTAAKGPV
jgi:phage tail-like protein